MKKMLNELVRYGKFAFALAFALCCFNASAATLPQPSFGTFAKAIEFTSSGYTGSAELANFPVLVRLSANSPTGFSYDDVQSDGSDIRFADVGAVNVRRNIDIFNRHASVFLLRGMTDRARHHTGAGL